MPLEVSFVLSSYACLMFPPHSKVLNRQDVFVLSYPKNPLDDCEIEVNLMLNKTLHYFGRDFKYAKLQ